MDPANLPQERDCSSPLGLFERFRLDSPVNTSDESDVQFVSELEPPRITWQNKHSTDTSISQDLDTASLVDGSTVEKTPCLFDAGKVTTIKKRQERTSVRLLASWNVDCRNTQILNELESSAYQPEKSSKEVYDVVDDDDDDNEQNHIIQEVDGELSESCYTVMTNETYGRDDQQRPAKALSSKIYQYRSTTRKKPYGKEKTSGSCKRASALSEELIRANTVQVLSDVLLNRVQGTENLQVQKETVKNLATTVEKELFNLYNDTGIRYKNKYRSLIFNLKDTKNKILFHRVVHCEITPKCLVQMSAAEMAGQELSEWRNQEKRHNLEIIERAEKDFQHKQKIKFTHKGLIEIETSLDEFFTLEDLSDTSLKEQAPQKTIIVEKTDTTSQHKSHLLDVNCLICMGKIRPLDREDTNQWTLLKTQDKEKENNKTGQSYFQAEITTENTKQDDWDVQSPAAIWKGFIQMFSIKKFKVTAMQVSGYSSHLCQELPDVILSNGFICPESVWEFVELIWPASTKDMCLLRLCPRTASDAVSYSRLFSYLNRKLRYGIVRTQKMEAFVVPLPAHQPIPPRLRPLGGPGLEDDHPHLLLALLLPNHQSWTSVPKKASPIQKEFDVPDDIFSSILEDVEKEMEIEEQGLPNSEPPSSEQTSGIGEVGMQELMGILGMLSNNFQNMAVEAQNTHPYNNLSGQPNYAPEMGCFWPSYSIASNFQPPNPSDGNPPTMFDPLAMYGPPNFYPFQR